jgi:membrane protein YdbS with pleckstrin-like domain
VSALDRRTGLALTGPIIPLESSTEERRMNLPFDLQPTEEPGLLLRRHWLHLYPRLAAVLLVAVLPAFLWVATTMLTDVSGTARLVAIGVSILWTLVWAIRAYFLWYRYQHDVWAVTNQRIVDSLKRDWFHHQLSSADLIDIEDVSVHREGPLRTMFDYGDVRVQTAAQQPHFVLSAIPHPRQVLTTIDAMRDVARREHTGIR